MDVRRLSSEYQVRELTDEDIDMLYDFCIENPMFYEYCPPFVTKENIQKDMKALPPKKEMKDKFYLGFFEGKTLVAVLDLIIEFPNEETAFWGFFMMNRKYQGKGIGTKIVDEAASYLKEQGFNFIRLGFVKGNPQSEAFWVKNGFERTGVEVQEEKYVIVVMNRRL